MLTPWTVCGWMKAGQMGLMWRNGRGQIQICILTENVAFRRYYKRENDIWLVRRQQKNWRKKHLFVRLQLIDWSRKEADAFSTQLNFHVYKQIGFKCKFLLFWNPVVAPSSSYCGCWSCCLKRKLRTVSGTQHDGRWIVHCCTMSLCYPGAETRWSSQKAKYQYTEII